MLKVSCFLGDSEYGPAVIPLFGPADRVFEKTAAATLLPEVSQYISELRPRPDAQYVLVNAMGAGEYYGSNINGDYFSEASLIHAPDNWTGNPVFDRAIAKNWGYGFPTFYGAHPYAHHKNKDASRAFGEVELTVWNSQMKRVELVVRVDKILCEKFGGVGVWDKLKMGQFPDVSMGCKVPYDTCFPAGTLVRAFDGHKPIEDLRVGDFVLTHTGASHRITQVMSRRADGLVRLHASGLPRVEATDNHPFLVLRREQVRTCKGAVNGNRLRHSINNGSCKRCHRTPSWDPVWAAAETLRVGDYLAVPASAKPVQYDISSAQARLLGYYLGDGYIIKQRTGKKKDGDYRDMGFGFSVGTAEGAHLDRLLHTIVEAGSANEPQVYAAGCGRAAHIVSVYDQNLAAWLQKWGGRTSHGKRLLDENFFWSREAKLELVAGYIDTDGSVDARGQVRIASVNRGLLLDVQRLLLSEGITATVCFGGSGGGYENSSETWYLVLSAAQAQKLLGRSTKIVPVEVGWESPQSFFWGEYWFTPVKSIEEVDGEVEVFNISVEKDESYVAEGRAVHNCSICLDWETYRKAQATFDPRRQKTPGEAVLAYHKAMQGRLGHGIRGLSITRADYCQHAKNHMNKILPDGRKVFVYNDYPRFFDISFVFVGADKTAKVMMKIAGEGKNYWFLSGAELAEKLGYDAVDETLGDASPGLSKVASVSDETLKIAFLGKLAKNKNGEITKEVVPSQFAGKAVPVLTKSEPSLPKELLNILGNRPLEEALSTPTGLGIVLRPHEFQRIVLIRIGRPQLADQLDEEERIFPETDEAEDVPMDSSFFHPSLARLLLPFINARSGLGPFVEKRVVIAGNHKSKEDKRSSSLSTSLQHKLGAAYNGYRAGVMKVAAGAQQMIASTAHSSVSDFHKIAEAPVSVVFTPLSAAYFKFAFMDEMGTKTKESLARADVEREHPSRNT